MDRDSQGTVLPAPVPGRCPLGSPVCGSVTTDTLSVLFQALDLFCFLFFRPVGHLYSTDTHCLSCGTPDDCRIPGLQSLRQRLVCLLFYLFLSGKSAVFFRAGSPLCHRAQLPSACSTSAAATASPSQLLFPLPWQPKHGSHSCLSTSERKAMTPLLFALLLTLFLCCLFGWPRAHCMDWAGLRFVSFLPPEWQRIQS